MLPLRPRLALYPPPPKYQKVPKCSTFHFRIFARPLLHNDLRRSAGHSGAQSQFSDKLSPMPHRPHVLVTEGSAQAPLDYLRDFCHVHELPVTHPDFPATLAKADALIVRTYTKVNAEFLKGAPLLKVVGRGGVGLENIDVPACRARGIQVVYTPDANTLAVGDFTLGAILRLIRPWAEFPAGGYTPKEFKHQRDTLRGRQLNELTLGILGLGRVGSRLAQLVHAFGTRILFTDINPAISTPLATRVDLSTLLAQSDILTLHADMREGNHHLIGARELAQMKRGGILINHARGELLDLQALSTALQSGHLAGAAIDVFDPEPPTTLPPLPNAILTPHMAARTHTAIDNMSWVTKDILRVLRNEAPHYPAP